jgi:hypothetical protein
VAAANRVGRLVERVGVRADLSVASLLAAARRRTGLDDFGDDGFLEPVGVLTDALEREARLHPIGRLAARENLIRVLSNRLRIEADLRAHPEILDIEIEAPLFIVGMQRTGTTVVHRSLAQDPGLRVLMSWEAINPAPPGPTNGRSRDPRVRTAAIAETSLRYLAPDFFAIHPVEAESPEEDCLLLDYAFLSTVPEATQQVPTFSAWLEAQDHGSAYAYLEKILKYLSWQRPGGRWLLKSPHHLEHLNVVLRVFPGARVVWTHRDPATALASFASMMAHAYGVFSDEVDPRTVGRRWLRKTSFMVERALAARADAGDGPFVDVRYRELVADPVGEIERIAKALGRPFPSELERRIRRWLRENPQHKHGRHRYDLGRFGLDRREVESRFADYRARFELEPESGER